MKCVNWFYLFKCNVEWWSVIFERLLFFCFSYFGYKSNNVSRKHCTWTQQMKQTTLECMAFHLVTVLFIFLLLASLSNSLDFGGRWNGTNTQKQKSIKISVSVPYHITWILGFNKGNNGKAIKHMVLNNYMREKKGRWSSCALYFWTQHCEHWKLSTEHSTLIFSQIFI